MPSESSAPGLEPGTLFANDYRVVRLLAEGGMGAVYVVDQISTGKPRALKVIRPELCGDADLRRRFQQEARIGARIESEHVVEIHSAGIDEATRSPYIVMELLEGEALDERLRRAGPMGAREVLELFEQLCHAMGAAHDASIVHRDLKPENVFLAESKRAGQRSAFSVKVLDFGIAKLVETSATRGRTVGMIGTPAWMAPEQTERGTVTPAADVWALGLILYWAFTGRYYWTAANDREATFTQVLKEVVMGPLPRASQRAREQGVAELWPAWLDPLFERCVVRQPDARYADARELWAALRSALSSPDDARAASEPQVVAGDRRSSPEIAASGGRASRPELGGPAPWAGATVPLHDHTGGPSATAPTLVGTTPPRSVTTSGARSWILGLVLVLVALGTVQMFARLRQHAREQDRPTAAKREVAPASAAPPKKPAARPSCRLCTTDLVVSGGLQRDVVLATVETAFPLFEAQCLDVRARKGRGVRAGSATLRFKIHDGAATMRKVVASTSTDGADECLVRALADVRFPIADPTDVTYSVQYDPSFRR